jgi:hypothetical protein
MKRLHKALPICACVALAWTWAFPALGAESHPWWNPLGLGQGDSPAEQRKVASRTTAKPKSKSSSDTFPSWPHPTLPKLPLLSAGSERKNSPQTPGMWDTVSDGTKSFLTKTKDVLMPWADSSEKSQPSKNASSSRKARTASSSRGKTEKSTFPFLSSSKKKDDDIKSVNDFLELPRLYE